MSKNLAVLPRLIGVIHLPALGGAPGAQGLDPSEAMQRAGLAAVQEAKSLTQAGFEGIILENFGDTPFYKSSVPPETIASMAVIAAAVREATRLPLGINVLRNDARAALAIASVAGAQFIRVNVLSGVAATDQGMVEGDAAFLLRERDRLAPGLKILADAHVKHSQTLSSSNISLAIEELALRSLADGVIVTGPTTGRAVSRDSLIQASKAATELRVPLYIGSGATVDTLGELFGYASGVIIGSAIRKAGRAGAPLDLRRIREIVRVFKSAKKSKGKLKKGS